MSTIEILLIIISGLGVIHGLFLAVFLFFYPKGNRISNKILSVLLIVLSFRVGKSVLMEFAQDIDIKLICIGLGTLMAIGPLFYLYTRSLIEKEFRIEKKYLFHFIPAVAGICFGFWINDNKLQSISKWYFLAIFIFYYGHYLGYLISGYLYFTKKKKKDVNQNVHQLLSLLFYALLIIWVVYVLNLFDEFIPYIIGPILYTLVAYIVSFIVIQKGYIQVVGTSKYKSTSISDAQINTIFDKVLDLVVTQKQFKDDTLSLKLLSQKLKVSTQVLSMVVNKQSKTNFNNFINRYRIEEAIKMFKNEDYKNHTIASIAFEVGFSSISSFNSAFKKQTGKTPLMVKKDLIK